MKDTLNNNTLFLALFDYITNYYGMLVNVLSNINQYYNECGKNNEAEILWVDGRTIINITLIDDE